LQLTAYLDRIPVASAFFLGAGDTFTYLFAASDYTYHKLSASYILQWEAIQLAKKLGYKFYDFFGVAPGVIKDGEYVYDHKHRYAGITKFKLGFGGAHQASLGTFDIILDKKKYWFYKTLRFVYGIFKISRSRRAG
jgi:lipid II:glycine glycyltransferase (peptidoglycan interpeptide bridge formation enzyme)